jgi:hypothetical protein
LQIEFFGKPVLSWTVADAKAAMMQAQKCGKKAWNEKRKQDAGVFRTIRGSLNRNVISVLGVITRANKEIEQAWQALIALPPSKDGLRVIATLDRMGTGGAMEPADWRVLTGGGHTADYMHGRTIVTRLRKMPDARTEARRPAIAERYAILRRGVMENLQQTLSAGAPTFEGLVSLDTTLSTTHEELGPALTEDDYAALEQTATARRSVIETKLLEEQLNSIASAPTTLDGLVVINNVLTGAIAKALKEPNSSTLQNTGLERREIIGSALADSEIAKLDDFPETLEGLHRLQEFEVRHIGSLAKQITGAPLVKFQTAVDDRFAVIGKAALSEYEDELDALAENEVGMRAFEQFQQDNAGVVERLSPVTRMGYLKASRQRFQELEEGVEDEQLRLAKLPLRNSVFVQQHGPTFEFRKKQRVYMSYGGNTIEGEYEEDDDRVIVRFPDSNMVFTRDGGWLRGNGMDLKRKMDG